MTLAGVPGSARAEPGGRAAHARSPGTLRRVLGVCLLAVPAVLVCGCALDAGEPSAAAASVPPEPGGPVPPPSGQVTGPATGPARPDGPDGVSGPPFARQRVTDPQTGPYGSGRLGPWIDNARSVSTPEQFRRVVDADGLLIVGDSVAAATSRECAARIGTDQGLPTAVNTWNGRPTRPTADWIAANAGLIPDRGIVVVAGANDVFDPAGWWREAERVLAAAGGRPVFWLTVHVERQGVPDAMRAADRRNTDWINEQLRWLAARHPELVLVDWHRAVTRGAAGEAPLSDGVHPTAAGVEAWCDLVTSATGLAR